MSIFKSEEGEMARFERHMKPIRLLNENRRLKLIRDELKKDLQTERRKLKAKRNRARNSRARIEIISTSTIRATSETLAISGFQADGAKKPWGRLPRGFLRG